MKTLAHEFVDLIPDILENDVVYVSTKHRTAIHKCCCGCGEEVVTPLSPAGWEVTLMVIQFHFIHLSATGVLGANLITLLPKTKLSGHGSGQQNGLQRSGSKIIRINLTTYKANLAVPKIRTFIFIIFTPTLRIELNESICKGGNSGKRINIGYKKLISNE